MPLLIPVIPLLIPAIAFPIPPISFPILFSIPPRSCISLSIAFPIPFPCLFPIPPRLIPSDPRSRFPMSPSMLSLLSFTRAPPPPILPPPAPTPPPPPVFIICPMSCCRELSDMLLPPIRSFNPSMPRSIAV